MKRTPFITGRDRQYAFFDEAARWNCMCGKRCDPRNHPHWRRVKGHWEHWHEYPTGWVKAKRAGNWISWLLNGRLLILLAALLTAGCVAAHPRSGQQKREVPEQKW